MTSTCGDTRSAGRVISRGARSTPSVGGDDPVLGDQPGPHLARVDAVGRGQRGDGARLVDRFDDLPARHVGQRACGSARRPRRAGRGRARGPAATCSPSATERPTLRQRRSTSACASRSQRLVARAAPAGWPARRRRADRPSTCATTSTTASAPMSAQSRCANACAASTISGMPSCAAHRGDRRDGLHDAAVAAQRGEVHQRRRVGGQRRGGGIDVEPARAVDRAAPHRRNRGAP